ncbi:hypothetical protein [Spiroplasma endosymbiont of Cantharis lateralis]|uniref:hypothetical protein n=1 Tax=Spiroplasma endosymbiont of Cantharis lateralis TaxID=3066277 RepID=UPI00313CC763
MNYLSLIGCLSLVAAPTTNIIISKEKDFLNSNKNFLERDVNNFEESIFLREHFLDSLIKVNDFIRVDKTVFNINFFKDKELFKNLQNFILKFDDLEKLKESFRSEETLYVRGINVHVKWWQASFGIFTMDWDNIFIDSIDILTFSGVMTAAVAKYVVLLSYVPVMTTSYFSNGQFIVADKVSFLGWGVNVKFNGGWITSASTLWI